MAAFTGCPDIDAQGRNIIGEHDWRISGSRHLAELGVPQPMIVLMARWGSNVVMRYIADAPLRRLTTEYRERSGMATSSDAATAVPEPTEVPAEALQWTPGEAEQLAAQHVDTEDDPILEQRYAVNVDTNYVHIVAVRKAWERPIPGRARCGWDYKVPNCRRFVSIPEGFSKCGKCARPAAWAELLDEDGSASDGE